MDVIIAPSECKKLVKVRLPRPKDGQGADFFYDEEGVALLEVVKYSDKYRSWFIDNHLCPEGHFNVMTKIDPLFMFIPLVYSFASDKFRSLDDICEEYNVNFIMNPPTTASNSGQPEKKYDKIHYALSPLIEWSNICDVKDVDGDLFLRFSQPKTTDWLLKKHDRLMLSLKDELVAKSSKATLMSVATDLIGDYIPQWLREDFKQEVREKHIMNSTSI